MIPRPWRSPAPLSRNPVPAEPLAPLPAASDDPPRTERPSKTRLKQAMHELQDLGEALVGLPEDRIAALALPESLLAARARSSGAPARTRAGGARCSTSAS